MKTLHLRFSTAFFALFILTTLISFTACSDDELDNGIACDDPPALYELEVTGTLESTLNTDYGDKFLPLFVTKWQSCSSDSLARKSVALLQERMKDKEMYILMPAYFRSPTGEGKEFIIELKVHLISTSDERYTFVFEDFIQHDICGTPDPEIPISYGSESQ